MRKKVLIVNYFLFIGGGEKLLIELVEFCLRNNIQPEILITEKGKPGDNIAKEFYDDYLEKKGVKVHRVPICYKPQNYKLVTFYYWRAKLRFSDFFYNSVHIINLNLSDRMYETIKNKNRYFWHIVNRIQYNDKKYTYRQLLTSNPNDNIVIVNKYQLVELKEYFQNVACNIIPFKLFLNH